MKKHIYKSGINNVVLCNDRRIAWGNEVGCESRRTSD